MIYNIFDFLNNAIYFKCINTLLIQLFIVCLISWKVLETQDRKLNTIILPPKIQKYPHFYNSIKETQFVIDDTYTQSGDYVYVKIEKFTENNEDIVVIGTMIGADVQNGFFTILPDDDCPYEIIKTRFDNIKEFRVIKKYNF